jgi:hypothetical protein
LDPVISSPTLIYDDRCSSCTIFAEYAFKYSRGQINCIGHYSNNGQKLRKLIFPANYNETEMFWLIKDNNAYGGRSGLLPLLILIIKGIVKSKKSGSKDFPKVCFISEKCNDKKNKMKRIFNLLRSGKKLKIELTSIRN